MRIHQQRRGLTRPASLGLFVAAAGMAARPVGAAETVRIGLPTKTYWPTIITEAASRQKLFDREGIGCESTIYRGGAECFEALAAGAADVILDPPSLVGAGLNKRIKSKIVATASLDYQDWYLMVPPDGFGARFPHELSGGMRQRVSISRGLVQDPPALLMDEPFAALDEQTRMTMGEELLRIWAATRKTIVFVTHSLTEAVYLSDEVLVMSARPGRIVDRIEVDLPRPRTYEMLNSMAFGRLRDRIWQHIRAAA